MSEQELWDDDTEEGSEGEIIAACMQLNMSNLCNVHVAASEI